MLPLPRCLFWFSRMQELTHSGRILSKHVNGCRIINSRKDGLCASDCLCPFINFYSMLLNLYKYEFWLSSKGFAVMHKHYHAILRCLLHMLSCVITPIYVRAFPSTIVLIFRPNYVDVWYSSWRIFVVWLPLANLRHEQISNIQF